jgi:hypothetical protein
MSAAVEYPEKGYARVRSEILAEDIEELCKMMAADCPALGK